MMFRVPLSDNAPCTYAGVNSSIEYSIDVTLDIPHGSDYHFAIPFSVGLRSQQQPLTAPQVAASPPPQPLPVPQASADQAPDVKSPESIILEGLSDGSPHDLVSISSILQEKTGKYQDINQVHEMCEKLVADGKLERTGEGEFLAQYSMKW